MSANWFWVEIEQYGQPVVACENDSPVDAFADCDEAIHAGFDDYTGISREWRNTLDSFLRSPDNLLLGIGHSRSIDLPKCITVRVIAEIAPTEYVGDVAEDYE